MPDSKRLFERSGILFLTEVGLFHK